MKADLDPADVTSYHLLVVSKMLDRRVTCQLIIISLRPHYYYYSVDNDVLHWLQVKQRITYKIATMAFSCVRGTCLAYFSDVSRPVQTVAERACAKLRSAHHGHLIVPATKSKTFGSHSLRSAAPTVWNSLPTNLLDINIGRGQFASGLKSWLLGFAYT